MMVFAMMASPERAATLALEVRRIPIRFWLSAEDGEDILRSPFQITVGIHQLRPGAVAVEPRLDGFWVLPSRDHPGKGEMDFVLTPQALKQLGEVLAPLGAAKVRSEELVETGDLESRAR